MSLALDVLTVVVVAGTFLALLRVHASREQRRQRDDERRQREAQERARVAATQAAGFADHELREAWSIVIDALQRQWITDAARIRELVAALERGGGLQLAEECSVDVDDEHADRVRLYSIAFQQNQRTCSRSAFLDELRKLATALES